MDNHDIIEKLGLSVDAKGEDIGDEYFEDCDCGHDHRHDDEEIDDSKFINEVREIHEIFRECFPQCVMNLEQFASRLALSSSRIIRRDGGFAVINKDTILLLCVSPEYQHKGVGTTLVHDCEEYIRADGYTSVTLGAGSTFFFPGVPEIDDVPGFFEDLGYETEWVSADLMLELSNDPLPCDYPENVTFGYMEDEELDQLLDAVHEVNENWYDYFEDEPERTFVARASGKVVGFCQIGNCNLPFANGAGGIGCVGVLPAVRRHGIGLAMVREATLMLRDEGYSEGYIAYTHLEDWYKKLGYETVIHYCMSKKQF